MTVQNRFVRCVAETPGETVAPLRHLLERCYIFLTASSLFLSISGFFKTYLVSYYLGVPAAARLGCLVFLITFSTYGLNRVVELDQDAGYLPDRKNFLTGRGRSLLWYTILAYILAAILSARVKAATLPVIFFPLAVNSFYSLRLIPGLPRLKEVPVAKNLAVALSWALVCTLLPAVTIGGIPPGTAFAVFYFILIKSLVNTILYDIRDLEGDRSNGIRTLPVLLGIRRMQRVLLGINTTLIPWLALVVGEYRFLAALLILYGYACILYFSRNPNPRLLDFFVDGEWLLAFLLAVLIRVLVPW